MGKRVVAAHLLVSASGSGRITIFLTKPHSWNHPPREGLSESSEWVLFFADHIVLLRRVAIVAILPFALFDERFVSLGASWVFSITAWYCLLTVDWRRHETSAFWLDPRKGDRYATEALTSVWRSVAALLLLRHSDIKRLTIRAPESRARFFSLFS